MNAIVSRIKVLKVSLFSASKRFMDLDKLNFLMVV